MKLGYQLLAEVEFAGQKKWWRPYLWGVNAQVKKVKILLWLALEKKILTWDKGLKREWVGPGRCALCRAKE
jgi:hypothetical protein